MANKTVYPYGTGGQLPSSIGIVNDGTTGGVDKAWSAEMGKNTWDRIAPKETRVIDVSSFQSVNCSLGPSKKWTGNNGAKHIAIPVRQGASYVIEATNGGSGGGFYGFVTSSYATPTSGSTVPYANDGDRGWLDNNTIITKSAPSEAAWLILGVIDGSGLSCSWSVTEIYEGVLSKLGNDVQILVNSLIEKQVTDISWTNGKYLDADPTSETFAQPINNANYAYHNYVDCSGYKFLKVKMFSPAQAKSGIVFYDSEKTPITGFYVLGYSRVVDMVYEIPQNAVYFRNSFWKEGVSGYSAILSNEEYTTDDLKAEIDKINDFLEFPPSIKATTGVYVGEKIMLKAEHPFGIEVYMTATKDGDTSRQGAACYGDTLFTFHATNNLVEVFNMRTKQRTQVITPTGGNPLHCNEVGFSTLFYDSSDPFPLLYISSGATEVWRITGTEGSYEMTLIQTFGEGADMFVSQDGTCWKIGWGGGATWDTPSDGGYVTFTQYKLPAITDESPILDPNLALKEVHALQQIPIQDGFIKGGNLYFCYGYASFISPNYGRGVCVIDLDSGKTLSLIDLGKYGFTFEPEGLIEWDGALYMTVYNNDNLYRLYV